MVPFILRRLLYMIPVIIGVSVCVFLIIHMMPGDPARIMAGIDASEADVRVVRHSLRLDEPCISSISTLSEGLRSGISAFLSGRADLSWKRSGVAI